MAAESKMSLDKTTPQRHAAINELHLHNRRYGDHEDLVSLRRTMEI